MTTDRLRIAIATAGRFHVLDLARELDALGHAVAFHSYVPGRRARQFGLPGRCHISHLAAAAPWLAWGRLAPHFARDRRERGLFEALDHSVATRVQPCDAFICMSGIYLHAAMDAKRRYGASIWLERGSRHIESQDEILAAIPGAARPSRFVVERELEGYRLADRIVVPSRHVEESFARDPACVPKVFRLPYGVDLRQFPQRAQREGNDFTLLFAGTWSLQKGCDVLARAVRQSGVKLVHVGAIADVPFPRASDLFEHRPAVDQRELPSCYAHASAFVLASIQDGFGLVLAQALASGLPIICTDRTGGGDLAHTPALASRITVVPHGDADALAHAILRAREEVRSRRLPALHETDRETLSWRAYGQRYSEELLSFIRHSQRMDA